MPRLLANLTAPSKGLVGPWAHGWPLMGVPGPAIGFLQEVLRWWDHWLKGAETGIMDEPRYRVWMQQAMPRTAGREEQPGRWVAEARWPSATIVPQRLHLNPGRLAAAAEAEIALTHRSVQYNGRTAGAWCPYATGSDLDGDQRADDGLSLVFDSLPLTAGVEILGAPIVELELAVDRPLALIAARLCDVDEHGASNRVTYGVLNLTHRESHAAPTPLQPGRRYRVRLQLSDIAYGFPAGHRVRLALSTSYWPIVWPSPATVTLTVYTGASVLELPVRPAQADDAALPPFGEPEGAAPPAMTTLAPGSGRSEWRYDLAGDTAELAFESEAGLERFDAIGIAAGVGISEHYNIKGDDPLSARQAMAWTLRRERADWRVRIEAKVELRSTAGAFLVHQSLAAFEGDTRVYARDWNREIARDLV